jgi:hypothetical protein
MTAFTHTHLDSLSDLNAVLGQYAEAGIDPAFDAGCEELERQFAELRVGIENL